MPQITIGSNAEAGVYVATLKKIGEIYEKTWPDGKVNDQMDWEWLLPTGEILRESTSTATGPRSKLYARLVALNNGRPPKQGDRLELADYYGRRVIVTIEINDNGYPKINNVGPLPLEVQQQDFAAATGAPVSAPAPQQLHPQPAAAAQPAAAPDAIHGPDGALLPTTVIPADDALDF